MKKVTPAFSKNIGAALIASTLVCTSGFTHAFSEANSSYFNVSNYMYPSPDGSGWKAYNVSGFYTPAVGNTKAEVAVFPTFSLDKEAAIFLDENGVRMKAPSSFKAGTQLRSIKIPVNIDASLPDNVRGVAIASQVLEGSSLLSFIPPLVRNAHGQPQVNDKYRFVLPPQDFHQINNMISEQYRHYDQQVAKQVALQNKWQSGIKSRLASMDEMTVTLMVDNEEVAEVALSNTAVVSTGRAALLTINYPDTYTANQFLQGYYDVKISYSFRDKHQGSINVKQNYAAVMDEYVRQAKSVATRGGSSGFNFFIISNRREFTKQSVNEHSNFNRKFDEKTNTEVVLEDASDRLVKWFEREFFPEQSKQQTITLHFSAAEKAEKEGNHDLAKAHREYAQAVMKGNRLKEADVLGAAAALTAGDFASFLAKGVAFKTSSHSQNYKYNRVVTAHSYEGREKRWTGVEKTSVRRTVTVTLAPEDKVALKPHSGLCAAVSYNFPGPRGPVPHLIPTCVVAGSPLHAAGILPGTPIHKMDRKVLNSFADYVRVLESQEAGDEVKYEIMDLHPQRGLQLKPIRITLTGAPSL